MTGLLRPRRSPCATCPYRLDAPAGLWHEEEYAKLPAYDQATPYQPLGLFHCHSSPGQLCAGWAGCHDMTHSLAVRLALAMGRLDPATLGYSTDVPLHASGQAAADHGRAGLTQPPAETVKAAAKLMRGRAGRLRRQR